MLRKPVGSPVKSAFTSRDLLISERPLPLAENPIDILGILFTFIALIVMINLSIVYAQDTEFPEVAESAVSLIIKGLIGISLPIIIIFITKFILPSRTSTRKRAKTFTRLNLFSTNINLQDTMFYVYLIGAIASYFFIQLIGMFLLKLDLFQTVVTDVYAFYLSSAILEEALYRMGLILLFETAINYLFGKQKTRSTQTLAATGAIFIAAIFFVLSHQRYFSQPVALIVTFLGGISQGFFYWKSKSLIPPIFAHVFINMIAANSLIQTLGVS